MTFKPMTVAAGAILSLAISGQAWTADVKTMAADAAKDQATEITKDKGKAMLPKTGVASTATDPTKVVPTATDPTKAAKEKTIEMGKDKATDTIKGVVK